jgi:formylglycine-generating enzyme
VGNADEWVSDWYDEGYYNVSPKENPRGPAKGLGKVERGGTSIGDLVYRRSRDANKDAHNLGFRCAADTASIPSR